MPRERCAECGFDSDEWSDEAALDALGQVAGQLADAVAGLGDDAVQRRSAPDTWSIAEYIDHVREVLFIMRFVLDRAVEEPGVDLGPPLDPPMSAEPKAVDLELALSGVAQEAAALRDRLEELPGEAWMATAMVGDDAVDAHWICRHAVHDATHHLYDVRRLRESG